MRQYISVLMIATRTTIFKLLGILILMIAIEIGLFYKEVSGIAVKGTEALNLAGVFEQSNISLVCAVAFLAFCGTLCLVGYELHGSKLHYTLNRLTIKEPTIAGLWAGYNASCFILFWAVQALLCLLLGMWYLSLLNPAIVHQQTLFLTFYTNQFLHGLLPFSDLWRWLANVLLLVAISITAAGFSLKQRRGTRGIAVLVITVITVWSFERNIGGPDFILCLLGLVVAVYAVFSNEGILRGGQQYERK